MTRGGEKKKKKEKKKVPSISPSLSDVDKCHIPNHSLETLLNPTQTAKQGDKGDGGGRARFVGEMDTEGGVARSGPAWREEHKKKKEPIQGASDLDLTLI